MEGAACDVEVVVEVVAVCLHKVVRLFLSVLVVVGYYMIWFDG